MPIDPGIVSDAGPWVTLAVVLGAIIEGFRRGWWVAGFVYRREVERADRMERIALGAVRKTKRESDELA